MSGFSCASKLFLINSELGQKRRHLPPAILWPSLSTLAKGLFSAFGKCLFQSWEKALAENSGSKVRPALWFYFMKPNPSWAIGVLPTGKWPGQKKKKNTTTLAQRPQLQWHNDLGDWDSLDANNSLFAEINMSVILIVGGLFHSI